jgi:hypothetical protein
VHGAALMLIAVLSCICIVCLLFTNSFNTTVVDYATLIFFLSFGALLTSLVLHW